MKIHIITIFPESFESYFWSSIVKRAQEKEKVAFFYYRLTDFSDFSWNSVDDKAYGMHGQVLRPEPLSKAIDHIFEKVWKKIPVVYMSPSGDMLTQPRIERYFKKLEKEFIIICGHYEGIDQRIIDLYVDEKISIGKYVLSSWELAAMVLVDALVRLLPWVLGNELSHIEESYSKKLNRQKEYPVYTRPQEFMGKNVPDVLINGNHKKIQEWKDNHLT